MHGTCGCWLDRMRILFANAFKNGAPVSGCHLCFHASIINGAYTDTYPGDVASATDSARLKYTTQLEHPISQGLKDESRETKIKWTKFSTKNWETGSYVEMYCDIVLSFLILKVGITTMPKTHSAKLSHFAVEWLADV